MSEMARLRMKMFLAVHNSFRLTTVQMTSVLPRKVNKMSRAYREAESRYHGWWSDRFSSYISRRSIVRAGSDNGEMERGALVIAWSK